ncbi:hypothetical protein NZK33_20015 [Cyanobium sp. FGCU-6]|nr:hypothetical protein [Cyanobium sp. FGCU6]
MAFVLHALRPGDVFLDVGANVGIYPIAATFERLLRNLRLNDLLSCVDPHRVAVGAT